MRPNTVRELWRQGRPAIGSLLTLNSPLMGEVMGHVGFDWLGADLQHSETNLANVQAMFQAVSSTAAIPFVRVAGNDSILIQRVLDLGAYGIIVPMVETVEGAQAAVHAAKYAPMGARSWGPIRGALYGGERITHAIIGIIYGGMLAFLIPILADWWAQPTALVARPLGDLGPLEWALLVMAVGVFLSGARDLYAALGLPGGNWPWPRPPAFGTDARR